MSFRFVRYTLICCFFLMSTGCPEIKPLPEGPPPTEWPEEPFVYNGSDSPTPSLTAQTTLSSTPTGITPTVGEETASATVGDATASATKTATPNGASQTPGPESTETPDRDGDGYSAEDGDCDINDPSVFPGAPDRPFDGVDSNCNGIQDFIVTFAGLRLGDGGDVTRARFDWPQDIALTSTPSTYSDTVYVSDRAMCRVRVLDDNRVFTLAGNGLCGVSEDGGQGTAAAIMPGDIAFDRLNERVYIAEPELHRIRYIDLKTGKIHTLLGTGVKGDPDEDLPSDQVKLCAPAHLTLSTQNGYNLYFTSGGRDEPTCASGIWRMRVYEPTGEDLYRLAGGGECSPMAEGPSRDSSVCPMGLRAFYANGVRLSVVDEGIGGAGKLFKISYPTRSDSEIVHLAGAMGQLCGAFNGERDATTTNLCFPASPGVTRDWEVLLPQVGTLIHYDPQQETLSHIAGEGLDNPANGATGAGLSIPMGALGNAIVDAKINQLMFIEPELSILRSMSLNGEAIVAHVAGHKGAGYQEGPVLDTVFSRPSGLAIQYQPEESLYVADRGNSVVRVIRGGESELVAGSPGLSGFAGDDGPAALAQLREPKSVAIAPNGDLYILTLNRVRRVHNGMITTVAGTGEAGFNGDDIPGDTAELNGPTDIVVSEDGLSLFIADSGNYRIRHLDLSSEPFLISTVVGTGDSGQLKDGDPGEQTAMGSPIALAIQGDVLYFSQDTSWVIAKLEAGVIGVIAAAQGEYGAGVTGIVPTKAEAQTLWVDVFGIVFFGGDDNILYRIGDGWPQGILGHEDATHYSVDQGAFSELNINITPGSGLVMSEHGSVYLSDEIHHVIRAMTF